MECKRAANRVYERQQVEENNERQFGRLAQNYGVQNTWYDQEKQPKYESRPRHTHYSGCGNPIEYIHN